MTTTPAQDSARDIALGIAREVMEVAVSTMAQRDAAIGSIFESACRAHALLTRPDVTDDIAAIFEENVQLRADNATLRAKLAIAETKAARAGAC